MKHYSFIRAIYIILCLTLFIRGYSQNNDTLVRQIMSAKAISPCRYVDYSHYDTLISASQIKDRMILSFFDSLLILNTPPILNKELFNKFINLEDSVEVCVYPLIHRLDTLFGLKAQVFGYPSPWRYLLSKAYCNLSNVKLFFLLYIENRYYNKPKIGTDQIITTIRLVNRNNKDLKISEYNKILSRYSQKIFDIKGNAESPLKELKFKWILQLTDVHPGWRKKGK